MQTVGSGRGRGGQGVTRDEATDLIHELERSLPVPAITCPEIDKVVESVKEVNRMCARAGRNYSDVQDFADAVEREFWNTIGQLEELRKANDRLMEVGRVLHELAETLVEEILEEEIEARKDEAPK